MKMWPKERCLKPGKKPCCSLNDIEDAKKVCDTLGIKHYVLNFEEVFRKEVIDYFVREYLSGRTPNPCIVCNEKIKFGALLRKTEELGCDFISTGPEEDLAIFSVQNLRSLSGSNSRIFAFISSSHSRSQAANALLIISLAVPL